ncbi:hypothetical protein B1757_01685 [Acidithiobacillus marinus]|uniref:DUF3150 domain-containing protein n=1 Tax=Acidithiobacillus marinus TaxID=187490 RepID=A0A2I1DQC2_9PROT|nr:DUF3150 domain-containing protein [Acidithiobacillus marinus]PKY12083.1 hypothetical protein B1757_01685 [Acidithiobacillus marinus]
MNAIVFMHEFKSISGSRALPRDLIESRDGRDLDKVLASSGTIQILPKDAVKAFGTARKAIETTLLAKGTRFFGGFLVSQENATEVQQSLEKIRDLVVAAKNRLAEDLEKIIDDRVKEAPEWEDVIRQSAPSREDIESSIHFGWVKTPVNLADPEIVQELKGNPLHIKIAKEIAQIATTWLGRPQGTGKRGIPGLAPLQQIQTKARALSFLDGRFANLDEALKAVIESAKTRKDSATGITLTGVLKVLTDPKAVLTFEETDVVESLDTAVSAEEAECLDDDDFGDAVPAPSVPAQPKTSRVLDWAF